MSEAPSEAYSSEIDPAFSRVWNEVFAEEDPPEAGADKTEAPEAGAGAATPPAEVEPAGQQPAGAAPAGGGEGATPAATPADAGGVPGGEGAGSAPAAGGHAAVPSPGGSSKPFAEFAPLFDTAATRLVERSEEAFREQAVEELRKEIDPSILSMLSAHPRMLVGRTVPSVKGEGAEVIKDGKDAADWQGAIKHILDNQVASKVTALMDDAKPVLSTLQDSVGLFRNNKDLVPNTAEYNPELAKRVMKLAGAYVHKVDGKAIGFRVDIQPLVDQIREDLKAAPAAPATPTPQQDRAAAQARTPEGKFDAPQAGIPSKQGLGGVEEDDYGTFWGAVGMPGMNI